MIGIILALFSAIATASAHALLKSGRDKLALRALVGAIGGLLFAPVCLFVPLPGVALLPWLVAANMLHTTYQFVLIRAYAANDFAVAYPVARGVAPIATALLGLALLGDRVTPLGLIGIGSVSAGILLVAVGRGMAPAGLAAALVAGLLTTTYTLVDAHAVRLAPVALSFVAWFFVVDGAIIVTLFAIVRRGRIGAPLRAEGKRGVVAGIVTAASFAAALVALRVAPVGIVSALRETSVLFGMAIAGLVLNERVGVRRAIGAVVIAAGAVIVVAAAA